MSTELDVPMSTQARSPWLRVHMRWRPGLRYGMELSYVDVSEGSREGPQTSPDLVLAATVIPSSGSESTLTADLDIDPEVEPELELERTHCSRLLLYGSLTGYGHCCVHDTGAAGTVPVGSFTLLGCYIANVLIYRQLVLRVSL